MIKKIFVRNCCGSNNFVDDFENVGLVLLSHHILSKNTVIKRNLTRLSKSTDKKRSDLSADNFHCSFSNKHIKNTQNIFIYLKKPI